MRIDPWLLITALVFFALLIALILASLGKNKNSAASKRLQALAPAKATTDTMSSADKPRREVLLPLLPAPLQRRLRSAFISTGDKLSLETLLLAALGGGGAVAALCITIIRLPLTITAPAVCVCTIIIPWFLLRSFQAKHATNFLKLFPDAIDLIVRAVRAGLPVSAALESAGKETPDPVGLEFRQILAYMRVGMDLDEALARAARRVRLVDFDFFVASLVLQRKSGGNLSETLAILSSVLRRREELRSKTKAVTSEARTSAAVLAALPFFAAGAILFINPEYFSILFSDPRGAYIMGACVLNLALGMLSMRFLIKKALA
ncbi:MAG TPA: type II secretion system F family protein [Aliidongia sp.]|nr:type II secretion system F family protein [Aliidongia sp.]